MGTLSFAVAITTATASHAETIEEMLQTLRGEGVSGLHDGTALIVQRSSRSSQEPCTPPNQSRVRVYGTGKSHRVGYYRDCTESEARFQEEMWARSIRYLLGDPGRH